jgi:hypothetical protein
MIVRQQPLQRVDDEQEAALREHRLLDEGFLPFRFLLICPNQRRRRDLFPARSYRTYAVDRLARQIALFDDTANGDDLIAGNGLLFIGLCQFRCTSKRRAMW